MGVPCGDQFDPSGHSLLASSQVGLKSKRFVFKILLARENRGEWTGEEGQK